MPAISLPLSRGGDPDGKPDESALTRNLLDSRRLRVRLYEDVLPASIRYRALAAHGYTELSASADE